MPAETLESNPIWIITLEQLHKYHVRHNSFEFNSRFSRLQNKRGDLTCKNSSIKKQYALRVTMQPEYIQLSARSTC